MPASLKCQVPVEEVEVSAYVKDLLDFFCKTHESILNKALEDQVSKEKQHKGTSWGLKKGDPVLLIRPPKPSPDANKGAERDLSRCYDEILIVKEIRGGNNYDLETLMKGSQFFTRRSNFLISADRLVKFNLPAWGNSGIKRRLEYTEDGDNWIRGRIEDMSVDGRVLIQREDNPSVPEWVDLAKLRYRWLADAYGGGRTVSGVKVGEEEAGRA